MTNLVKNSTPDWLADIFETAPIPSLFHTPAIISEANGVLYAICVNCDNNVEAWLDEEFGIYGSFGIRNEFKNGATLSKVCCP